MDTWNFVFVNAGSGPDAAVQALVSPVKQFFDQRWAPVWMIPAIGDPFDVTTQFDSVSNLNTMDLVGGHIIPVIIQDMPPDPSEGGFHEITQAGIPYIMCYWVDPFTRQPNSTKDCQVDVFHEFFETCGDMSAGDLPAEWVKMASGKYAGDFLLRELADPCEATEYGQEFEGVWVSDCETPEYYGYVAADTAKPVARGEFSFFNNLRAPAVQLGNRHSGAMLPGGYASFCHAGPDGSPDESTVFQINQFASRRFINSITHGRLSRLLKVVAP